MSEKEPVSGEKRARKNYDFGRGIRAGFLRGETGKEKTSSPKIKKISDPILNRKNGSLSLIPGVGVELHHPRLANPGHRWFRNLALQIEDLQNHDRGGTRFLSTIYSYCWI